MKAIILAGGRGTRLRRYNGEISGVPKPMLKLGEIPLLEIIIKHLVKHGFTDIIISTGYKAEIIEKYFKNNKITEEVKISFSKQEPLLGTAGPVSIIPELNDTFLVMHGDILTNLNFSKLLEFHKKNKASLTLAVRELRFPHIGIIRTEGDIIKEYSERSSEGYLDSMSVFVCEPQILKYLKKNSFLDLDDFINKLVENKEKVMAYQSKNFFMDIENDEDYEKLKEEFSSRKDEFLI